MTDKPYYNLKSAMLALLVAVTALVAGCTNPVLLQDGFRSIGSLRLAGVLAGETGVQTVFPDTGLTSVESYVIVLGGSEEGRPDEAQSHEKTVDSDAFNDSVEFSDLVPGEWTIEVSGYDAPDGAEGDGVELVYGYVEDVPIVRGEIEEITVPVTTTGKGEGSWQLTLDWEDAFDDVETPDTDVVTRYEYTLTDLETDEVEYDGSGSVDADAVDVSLGSEGENVDAGQYLLGVELINEDSADEIYETVSTYYEVWYIFGGSETAASKTLSESNFSFGGGATINIELEIPDDLEGFFDATAESTVAAGEKATLNLGGVSDVIDTDNGDEVTWLINGDKASSDEGNDETDERIQINDASEDGLTFSPDSQFPPGVTLNITLQIKKDGDFYSGSHAMTVDQP